MTDESLWIELAKVEISFKDPTQYRIVLGDSIHMKDELGRRQLENDLSKAIQGLWDRDYFTRFGIGFPDDWQP